MDPERGILAFDLRHILQLLGPKGTQSSWEVRGVEVASGEAAEILEAISDSEGMVGGEDLIRLASRVNQIIDGEFRGYLEDKTRPWIIVRAVDSSAYDVESDDVAVLEQIRAAFRLVDKIPEA